MSPDQLKAIDGYDGLKELLKIVIVQNIITLCGGSTVVKFMWSDQSVMILLRVDGNLSDNK